MTVDLDNIEDDPRALKNVIRELLKALSDRDRDVASLRQQIALLLRHRFGKRSEKLDPEQLALEFAELKEALSKLAELPAGAEPIEPEEKSEPAPQKKGHGRSRLPENARRVRRIFSLPEAERLCPCCGEVMEEFGTDTSEQLDFVPASLVIYENIRQKYACKKNGCADTVVTAPGPAQVFERGRPLEGLLSQVITSKYTDHIPLTRLSKILGRHGVKISSSTLGDWVERSADLLDPLVIFMTQEVLQGQKLHTDDTPVPVLDRDRKKTREARLYVYVGDTAHPFVVFDYAPDHTHKHVHEFLSVYTGFLQADAFPGYDKLFKDGGPAEAACWAHARRGFYDARETDPIRGGAALTMIALLYGIERTMAGQTPEKVRELRQRHSVPILNSFKEWLETEKRHVLPQSPIGKAIAYASNHWKALMLYTEHGVLDIDNTEAERQLRRVAVGRNNWTFAGSDAGGRRAAILYSLVATCERHGVDPFEYFRDVLPRLATHPASRIAELVPPNWKPLPRAEAGDTT